MHSYKSIKSTTEIGSFGNMILVTSMMKETLIGIIVIRILPKKERLHEPNLC